MSPDGIPSSGDAPSDWRLEARVTRLEEGIAEVKAILRRLEPSIVRMDAFIVQAVPNIATKVELARLEVALADKPSKIYMWGVIGVLIAAYAAGLAGLAVIK